jgi:hypothetical protein
MKQMMKLKYLMSLVCLFGVSEIYAGTSVYTYICIKNQEPGYRYTLTVNSPYTNYKNTAPQGFERIDVKTPNRWFDSGLALPTDPKGCFSRLIIENDIHLTSNHYSELKLAVHKEKEGSTSIIKYIHITVGGGGGGSNRNERGLYFGVAIPATNGHNLNTAVNDSVTDGNRNSTDAYISYHPDTPIKMPADFPSINLSVEDASFSDLDRNPSRVEKERVNNSYNIYWE